MALGVKDLRKDTRSIEFDYVLGRDEEAETEQFEVVKVTYRPSVYTPKWETDLSKDQADTESRSRWLASFISQLVTEWDVEGEEGEAYPLDVESLKLLPTVFLAEIVKQVSDDLGKARVASKTG